MTPGAMLFAAGLGTRMGALTKDRPKPLIKVGGKTLLDHAIALTDIPEISARVVNVHYKAKMIRDHLQGQNIAVSDESDSLLDTGGGLRKALPLLPPGPVVTLNSDAVWSGPNPISLALDFWRDEMEALVVVVPKAKALGHLGNGDFALGPLGELRRSRDYLYTGAQILRPEGLAKMPAGPFSLNLFWDHCIARGTAFGVVFPGLWCDVGQPQSIPLAEAMLQGQAHV